MKKTIQNNILAGLIILLVCSCADKKWDDYYVSPEYLKDGSTFDVLKKNTDYKEFTSLLKKTGCDSLLSSHDTYTVFALRNGAFSGIDTITDLAALKKILSMQILPSIVFKKDMAGGSKMAVSGKLLKFATTTEGITVNNILITKSDIRTTNGVIHEVGNMFLAKPNLYDVIISDPDLSAFKDFISSSYNLIIDPVNNVILGFDTAEKPIYQKPINYILSSEYLSIVDAQDENVLSTGFFPSNNAVNKVFSDFLAARNGRIDLIVPRLGKRKNDTIIGGSYFRNIDTYPGDTAVLLNNLFKSVFVRGEIPVLTNNSNSFTNIAGNLFTVTKDQVKTDARIASNGYYYVLNDVTVPEIFYRKAFWFLPKPKVQDPAFPNDPTKTINNPDISYLNGTDPNPSVTSRISKYTAGINYERNMNVLTQYNAYTGFTTGFNFTKVGAMLDFRFQDVLKGYYKVELSYFGSTSAGLVSASYGSQQLEQNILMHFDGSINVVRDIGTINVVNDGEVKIRFTCTGSNIVNFNNYEFHVDFVRLTPVSAP